MTMPGTATNHRRTSGPGRSWIVAAALLAAAVGLLLFLLPFFPTSSTGTGSSGNRQGSQAEVPAVDQPRDQRQSLAQRQEWGAATALALPALVCAAPLLVHRRRRVVTITVTSLLRVGVVVGAASVGLFYLPSVALMIVGAIRGRDRELAEAG